jgi:hypothetical protein
MTHGSRTRAGDNISCDFRWVVQRNMCMCPQLTVLSLLAPTQHPELQTLPAAALDALPQLLRHRPRIYTTNRISTPESFRFRARERE